MVSSITTGRSNGRAISIEYTGAPASVARSRNDCAASHVAVGASVLLRPPRPWITTGKPLTVDELDEVVLVGRVEAADRALRAGTRSIPRRRARGLRERQHLLAAGDARRHRPVVEVEVRGRGGRRHPGGARGHRLA